MRALARMRLLCGRGLLASVLVAGLALTSTASFGHADVHEAQDFIRAYSDRVVSALGDPGLTDEQRYDEFLKLLDDGFAVTTISRFILGVHWRRASSEEREEFMEVFRSVLAARYSPVFEGASADKIRVTGARPVSGKVDVYVVASVIKTEDGKPARMQWRVKQTEEGFKIVDVLGEGISMALTLRDEYGSVVRTAGVSGLIDRLRAVAQRT